MSELALGCVKDIVLVLLRIPKQTLNTQIFPESVRHQNLGFFSRKWRLWVICSRNDIYLSGGGVQATLHNTVAAGCRPSSYRRPLSSGRVGAGSGIMVIGVVGSRRHHTVDHLSARDLQNVHGALHNKSNKRYKRSVQP